MPDENAAVAAEADPNAGQAAGAAATDTPATTPAATEQDAGRARGADGKFAAPAKEGEGQAAEDWRVRYAGEDAKLLKRLERFPSEKDLVKSWAEKDALISKGGHLPKPPADDAPDEVKAEWRKTIGVPDKPEGYATPKIPGFELGEGDEPLLAGFRSELHAAGAPQAAFDAGLKWYAKAISDAQAAQKAADDQSRVACEEALGEEWGGEYRVNLAAAQRKLEQLPGELGQALAGARGPDGKLLTANPEFMGFMARMAREEGLVPSGILKGGGDPMASISEQMAAMEAQMGDRGSAYWKDPKQQERYRELAEARSKLERRNAA